MGGASECEHPSMLLRGSLNLVTDVTRGPDSAKRQHRACPFRKAPSPTLSVTCFLSHTRVTGVSQGSAYHAPGSRASECLLSRWVWTQEQLQPTPGEKALEFIR